MTERKGIHKYLVTTGLLVDILMSFVFLLSGISIELILNKYVSAGISYLDMLLQCLIVPSFAIIRHLRLRKIHILILHPVCVAVVYGAYYLLGGLYRSNAFAAVFLFAMVFFNMMYSGYQVLMKKRELRAVPDGVYFSMALHLLLLISVGFSVSLYPLLVDAVLILMCYLTARQIDVFENTYFHSINSSSQPSAAIRRNNRLTVIVLVISVMFALCMIFIFPYEAFYAMLLALAKLLVDILLPYREGQDIVPNGDLASQRDMLPLVAEEGLPFPLKIVGAIIVILLTMFILNLLYNFIMRLIRNFRLPDEDIIQERDDVVTDIIEELDHTTVASKLKRKDFGKGEEYRIRKKYYDKVRKAIKKGVDIRKSSTPKQIESLIAASGDETIRELTPLYENVRYNKKGSS
ncbi:hypothetical protein SAMN05216413_0138 [Ruminococcaceae bacterium KH2T8]|nr:hypothetical protein SAMN05216413_0138 [Ruminococcaceae bacterium KH2T8]